ncbi:MAG: family 78 glycoside hydrolase catalytic domain [Clostridia bacterium]|nr:family 78 glycoside hydrolase catalytic domain [Clostridia bacterium]
MNSIMNARCEGSPSPCGIDNPNPVFSWCISADDKNFSQKTYRVKVRKGSQIVWDSGVCESRCTYGIRYEGLPLENLCRYEWEAESVFANGDSMQSGTVSFVTGIMDHSLVRAKWIEHPSGHDNPVFYGDFEAVGGLLSAYIAISGLGYYELKINGKKAHDSMNVPGWTDYGPRDLGNLLYPYEDSSMKRVLYNVHDITGFITEGSNRYEVMLGNGFFNQAERQIEGDMSYGTPRLFMEIHLNYMDGGGAAICSDESVFCTEGPLEFNNIFFGETRNDNIGMIFDQAIKTSLCKWEHGSMESDFGPGDRICEIIDPVMIADNIYDAGKNISGRVRIKACAPRGAEFTISYFDAFDADMNPDYGPSGGEWQIQENRYIFGENETVDYAETFGWRGFRYFAIEKDGDVSIRDISVESIHEGCARTGFFRTGNDNINWIYESHIASQLSNMHGGVPSDCPHRERLGYTGDGHITVDAALYSLDSVNFYKKWLRDIVLSQNTKTGFVPHTVPFCGGGGGPAWGSACAIVPYHLYRHTFDKGIYEATYGTIQKWVGYLEKKSDDLIINKEEDGSWCLGDWCIPVGGYEVEEVDLDKIFAALDPRLVNTCYFYHCVKICIEAGNLLARDTTYYKRLAERIKKRFNEVFWDEGSASYGTGMHCSNAYPLYMGLVPGELFDRAFESMLGYIRENGHRTDTGIFATPMVFSLLAEKGCLDDLDKLLVQEEFPSYGYMRRNGATTLWETWDGNASRNHPMFGGIGAFFFKYIAGIRYIGPENSVIIEPCFIHSTDLASACHESIYGGICVEWKRAEDGSIKVNVILPGNVRGVFKQGEKITLLGNGLNSLMAEDT